MSDLITLFSEESKRLEKAYLSLQKEFNRLRHTNKDLSLIVSQLSEGLIFVTIDGEISLLNKACQEILNCKHLIGKKYEECFDDMLFGFSMQSALKNENLSKKILLNLNTGKEIEVSASFIQGRGVVCILRDITDIQRLQAATQQGQRMKELGEMAAVLAHEIRNPLGGIEGFATLLCRDLQTAPEKAEMAHRIVEGARSLGKLVTNILEYAKPCVVHFSTIDLGEHLSQVIALFSADSKSLPCQLEKKSLKVVVDPDLLKRAFLNLLRNGSEAARSGVWVNIYEVGGEVAITVKDDGPGISLEHQQMLFTPFFTTKEQGTGLGLSEAHKMISAMGGTIQVDSTPPLGSIFTIKLPKEHDA